MADTYSYTAFIKNHTTETPHSSYFSTSSNNLSFSSTLLEEIYRSIDLGEGEEVTCRESMRKKRSEDANMRTVFKTDEEMANYQRACMIEKWMEKKITEKIIVRGKSTADLQIKMSRKDRQYSSSSSSDSSCGGGFFSSSEAESGPVVHRPKPVRTGVEPGISRRNFEIDRREIRRGVTDQSEKKPKHESGFLKTKSRALKIYGDLKKVRQPISPGGKVAAFLNSIFTARNLKKPKIAAACDLDRDSPSLKSACSSASSLSRSCLSKTTQSSKFSGGVKRSVRFSPASLTVDEDCHKKNNDNVDFIKTAIDEERMVHIMENNRRVLEAAGDFLMNYQKKDQTGRDQFEIPFDHLKKINVGEFEEGEEEEFDAESYASSDLFELDNLSAIGMERYREELPVYETTHLDKIQTMQMV